VSTRRHFVSDSREKITWWAPPPARVRTVFSIVPDNYVAGETAGLLPSIAWLADRFAGHPAPSTC
jgi:hypothetical protein